MRETFGDGSLWETVVGYSRAIRAGDRIFVAGTTSTDPSGRVIAPGDAYAQTVQILRRIQSVLERAGAGMQHVVRTRMFVTDITRWEEVGRAHGEFFQAIRPAATMVEVTRLIHPDLIVEIEVEALLE